MQNTADLELFSLRKYDKLEIQLIDIQESLKFDHRGLPVLKENLSKCFKVVYQIQQFFHRSPIARLYPIIKKVTECFSLTFVKFEAIISELKKQNQDNKTQKISNAQIIQTSPNAYSAKQKRRLLLGGVFIGQDQKRYLEQSEEPSIKNIQNKRMGAVKNLQKRDIIEQMCEIEDFCLKADVNILNCQSNIQFQLMEILEYFNECQKQALAFLNFKLEDNKFDPEISYNVLLEQFRTSKLAIKQMAERKLIQLYEINEKKIQTCRKKTEAHHAQLLAKEKEILKLQFIRQVSNQSTQTYEAFERQVIEEFVKQKTLQYENQKRRATMLQSQLILQKNGFENQRSQVLRAQQLNEKYKKQLEILMKQLEPMKQYLKTLNREYNQLYSKFKSIWEQDLNEVVQKYSEQYSTEMKASLVNTLKKILEKLGIPTEQEFKNKFKFRFDAIKGLEWTEEVVGSIQEVHVANTLRALNAQSKKKGNRISKLESIHQIEIQEKFPEILQNPINPPTQKSILSQSFTPQYRQIKNLTIQQKSRIQIMGNQKIDNPEIDLKARRNTNTQNICDNFEEGKIQERKPHQNTKLSVSRTSTITIAEIVPISNINNNLINKLSIGINTNTSQNLDSSTQTERFHSNFSRSQRYLQQINSQIENHMILPIQYSQKSKIKRLVTENNQTIRRQPKLSIMKYEIRKRQTLITRQSLKQPLKQTSQQNADIIIEHEPTSKRSHKPPSLQNDQVRLTKQNIQKLEKSMLNRQSNTLTRLQTPVKSKIQRQPKIHMFASPKIIELKNRTELERVIFNIQDKNIIINLLNMLVPTTSLKKITQIQISEIMPTLEKLEQIHQKECKTTICEHLQRFYKKLLGLATRQSQTGKKSLLKVQNINKIDSKYI